MLCQRPADRVHYVDVGGARGLVQQVQQLLHDAAVQHKVVRRGAEAVGECQCFALGDVGECR